MKKKIFVVVLLPLFFITTKVYAENLQYPQPITSTYNGTESSKQNFKPTAMTRSDKNNMMIRADIKNNPKVQEFKAKIGQISDIRKKHIVEKIDTNINSINTRTTTTMNTALIKMTTILNNVKEKETTIATSGANTSSLDSSIITAENAVADAQTAVTAQSQKQYTAVIQDASNSAALKTPMMQMFTQFRTDITSTYQKVLTAKLAVAKTVTELYKLIGGEKNASGAANLRP